MNDPTSTQEDAERALMAWAERLSAKERTLNLLQHHLFELMESVTKMARLIDEIRVIERGPAVGAETGARPALRLVKKEGN
jgi:hypothetical protein